MSPTRSQRHLRETPGLGPEDSYGTTWAEEAGHPSGGPPPATLTPLTLSVSTAQATVPYTATINSATAGSVIVATASDGTVLTVTGSGTSRTLSGTFATAGAKTVTLVETLAGATGSPKSTPLTVTVTVTKNAAAQMLVGRTNGFALNFKNNCYAIKQAGVVTSQGPLSDKASWFPAGLNLNANGMYFDSTYYAKIPLSDLGTVDQSAFTGYVQMPDVPSVTNNMIICLTDLADTNRHLLFLGGGNQLQYQTTGGASADVNIASGYGFGGRSLEMGFGFATDDAVAISDPASVVTDTTASQLLSPSTHIMLGRSVVDGAILNSTIGAVMLVWGAKDSNATIQANLNVSDGLLFGVSVPDFFSPNGQPAFFFDSVSGSDAANGKSAATARKTIASTTLADGYVLSLKKGSRFHEALADVTKANIALTTHGTGAAPIFDGSLPIPANIWAADPGARANVFYADVDHVTLPSTTGAVGITSSHYQLWYESGGVTTALTPYFAGASQSANQDYVRDHAGSFTANVRGSSVVDPRINNAEANPKQMRYFVHLPANASPISGGGLLYYADKIRMLELNNGFSANGITFQRGLSKDFTSMADHDSGLVQNVSILDVPGHAWVGSPVVLQNITATARQPSYLYGGAGIHFYRSTNTVGTTTKEVSASNSSVTGFGVGYYSHGNDATNEQKLVTLTDIEAINCATALQTGQTTDGWTVNRFRAIGCENFLVTETELRVSNAVWYSGVPAGFAYALQSYVGQSIILENCAIIFDAAVATYFRGLFRNNDASIPFRLEMRNCTVVNGGLTVSPGHAWLNVDLVLVNTIMSDFSIPGWWNSISATNSQFGFAGSTLAALRATYPGIGADCIDAATSPAVFLTDPTTGLHDVTLDPTCQPAIRGMGCIVANLPSSQSDTRLKDRG